MTTMRTVAEIDRDIDAVHAEIITRMGPFDEMSAAAWQAAWDAQPELRQRERALYYPERYNAQVAADRARAREATAEARQHARDARKASCPQRIEPKTENAYGDSFAAWRAKFNAALGAEQVTAPPVNWQVGAFNCNYPPEVAAYEVACQANPARRLRHVWER